MDLSLLLKGLIVGGALVAGLASTWLFKMKNDNPVEQIAEKILKEETGQDVDLSPEDK